MNIDFRTVYDIHQLGETATGCSRGFGLQAVRLRNGKGLQAFMRPARTIAHLQSSPPLQGASSLASEDRYAGEQHVARNPCYTLARKPEKCTLVPVQLPFLG